MPATNRYLYLILFTAMLLLGCTILYHDIVFMYPAYMHDWAQADRLSLAINFYDRGMNFFKPATHSLYSVDGITGVEFPIVSYCSAALGHIFGRSSISTCFRLLNISIACMGLLFLFLAGYRTTKNFWLSAFTPLFVFSSPVYTYYTSTYMPDASAASVVFVGFYFMLQYLQQHDDRKLLYTVCLLTIATLMKTSTGIYLIGFLSLDVLQHIRKPRSYAARQHLLLTMSIIGATVAVIGYYLYNNYLNSKYGSTLFLAKANPFKDGPQFNSFFNNEFLNVWMYEYFSGPQYVILALVTILGIAKLVKSRRRRELYLFGMFFIGSAIMLYLFGGQLYHHDYYVVPILVPLIAYLLLTTATHIRLPADTGKFRIAIPLALAALNILLFCYAVTDINRRTDPKYLESTFLVTEPITWAAHGQGLLDSLHVPKSEHIGVLNEESPNRALVYLDRRGYHIPGISWIYNVGMAKDIMIQNRLNIMVCSRKTCDYMRDHDPEAYARFFVPVVIREQIAVFKLKPQD